MWMEKLIKKVKSILKLKTTKIIKLKKSNNKLLS